MSTSTLEAESKNDSAMDDVVTALNQNFGACFHVVDVNSSGHCEEAHTQHVESDLDHEFVFQLAKASSSSARPQTAIARFGQTALAVPLSSDEQGQRVAVATVAENNEVLSNLADVILANHRLREEVRCLNDESESLSRQVIIGFEEQSLLRSMAAHLELSDTFHGPLEFAHAHLSELKDVVDAEAIYFVQNSECSADVSATGYTVLQGSGAELLAEEQVCELVSRESINAGERPVVRNNLAGTRTDQTFPQLSEFILVEIRNKDRRCGWLLACNRRSKIIAPTTSGYEGFTTVQASLLSTAASMFATNIRNCELVRQKQRLFTDMVRALVNAIEARDPYTCGHSERVALFAQRLAEEVGMEQGECERVYLSGLLHDVGKISMPDSLLGKPGALTDEEYNTLKKHPESGWAILQELDALRSILPGVLHHHECFDGTGYPDRLVGDEIPPDGRILSICDAYDAMTSDRPYRKGMSQDRAEEILREGAGRQWDPHLIQSFFSAISDMVELRNNYRSRKHEHRESRLK